MPTRSGSATTPEPAFSWRKPRRRPLSGVPGARQCLSHHCAQRTPWPFPSVQPSASTVRCLGLSLFFRHSYASQSRQCADDGNHGLCHLVSRTPARRQICTAPSPQDARENTTKPASAVAGHPHRGADGLSVQPGTHLSFCPLRAAGAGSRRATAACTSQAFRHSHGTAFWNGSRSHRYGNAHLLFG